MTRADLLLLTLGGYRLFAQAEDGRVRGRLTSGGVRPHPTAWRAPRHSPTWTTTATSTSSLAALPARRSVLPGRRAGAFRPRPVRREPAPAQQRQRHVRRCDGGRRPGAVSSVVALGATDFDNRRDIDLIVVSHGSRPRLFRNLRDGSFTDVAEAAGFPESAPYTLSRNGRRQQGRLHRRFFGRETAAGVWALSDGRVAVSPGDSAGGDGGNTRRPDLRLRQRWAARPLRDHRTGRPRVSKRRARMARSRRAVPCRPEFGRLAGRERRHRGCRRRHRRRR